MAGSTDRDCDYQMWLAEVSAHCDCDLQYSPCAGVMQGGACDGLNFEARDDDGGEPWDTEDHLEQTARWAQARSGQVVVGRRTAVVGPRDVLEELDQIIEEAGARVCIWFGAPPCPWCGGEHDPNGTDDRWHQQARLVPRDTKPGRHWLMEHQPSWKATP